MFYSGLVMEGIKTRVFLMNRSSYSCVLYSRILYQLNTLNNGIELV